MFEKYFHLLFGSQNFHSTKIQKCAREEPVHSGDAVVQGQARLQERPRPPHQGVQGLRRGGRTEARAGRSAGAGAGGEAAAR